LNQITGFHRSIPHKVPIVAKLGDNFPKKLVKGIMDVKVSWNTIVGTTPGCSR
jgi:hypothetical protein